VFIGLIPWGASHCSAIAQNPTFIAQTARRVEINNGKAHLKLKLPVAVYFENVVRSDPKDPNSPLEGIGRFNIEVYALHLLCLRVEKFPPAGLVATHWMFDGLFPFIELIILSWLTGRATSAPGFYAKLKTPVAATPEEDKQQVELSYADPHRFDDRKLF